MMTNMAETRCLVFLLFILNIFTPNRPNGLMNLCRKLTQALPRPEYPKSRIGLSMVIIYEFQDFGKFNRSPKP